MLVLVAKGQVAKEQVAGQVAVRLTAHQMRLAASAQRLHSKWDKNFEGEPLMIKVQGVRQAWLKVKDGYRGGGGYQRYLSDIGMLMILGEVEGTVGERALGQEWWRQACLHTTRLLGVDTGMQTEDLEGSLVLEGAAFHLE